MKTVLNLLYLSSLATISVVGLLFDTLSHGFHATGGEFLCRDLKSSGGDDDAVVVMFITLIIPIVIRLMRMKKSYTRMELLVLLVCLGLSVFGLWLAALDCADIWDTAFAIPDYALQAGLLGMVLALACGFALWRINVKVARDG
ncbi:hypothetical protein [Aliiroseovarius sp. F20344]|uniref:hypothetical protein n=1 Tax=Aliiroseovarius sp. F20344 TaxID=2926414 RepID=UPI001FF5F391|nr:hypothetical protein [Aliiroseovarius sp. F20344]MCK0143083.1 hypothetical protein [Aliiroseovarius sp. F20344]